MRIRSTFRALRSLEIRVQPVSLYLHGFKPDEPTSTLPHRPPSLADDHGYRCLVAAVVMGMTIGGCRVLLTISGNFRTRLTSSRYNLSRYRQIAQPVLQAISHALPSIRLNTTAYRRHVGKV